MGIVGAVHAHHSGAMFDDTKVIELTGVVKEFQYTNPHSWLLVDITNSDGSVTTWGFEAEGPSTLMRADGLVFHMPGRWQLVFEMQADGRPLRLTQDLTVR